MKTTNIVSLDQAWRIIYKLTSNTSIVQHSKDYEGGVKHDEDHQQQVERVPHVGPCEDDDGY